MNTPTLNPSIEEEFNRKHINRPLTLTILERFNRGEFDHFKPVQVGSLPQVDGRQIIDMTKPAEYKTDLEHYRKTLSELLPGVSIHQYGTSEAGYIHLTNRDLYEIGMHLLPKVAYGILNGGSATSYVDEKKNRSFSSELFHITAPIFEKAAAISRDRPKSITPAFINPDGSPGPSFLELKIRALLIQSLHYRRHFAADKNIQGIFPLFQMTSIYTDAKVTEALQEYRNSPYIGALYNELNPATLHPYTAVQPLIAAYTHSSQGRPKGLFTEAWGKPNTLLPLPGGHGQNFTVLSHIYRDLYSQGYRYAYLGNIDNLGNTVDPTALALLALSGKQGAFEFSFKTPVDVKGGILVRDETGRLNAADIGPAISEEELRQAEQSGTPILFNCASGIFDLKYLNEQLEYISAQLPTRFSDQDKDAGRYSQAEQITWEIIGMMDSPLIFGVHKYDRFLASKLLIENLMTSGIGLESPEYPPELRPLASNLHNGLIRALEGPYGLKLDQNRWIPKAPEEIE